MARKRFARSVVSNRSTRAEFNLPVANRDMKPSVGGGPKPSPVTQVQIARRAYELFLARGGVGGDPLHDWLRAESELSQARAA